MLAVICRILASLAMLLLAAHFLRDGHMVLVSACLLVNVPVWLPRRAARVMVQVVLILAALEWLRTLLGLAHARQAMGQPWTRMAVILGSVAAFNLLVCLLLAMPFSRKYEKSPPDQASAATRSQ